jgi:5-hydroxyisourate hydrolase
MRRISTHVLDTAQGAPARNVPVRLERQEPSGDWRLVGSARTDQDGRCGQLLPEGEAAAGGIYRMTFDAASYYAAQKIEGLYPLVQITFAAKQGEEHFHIPLLLSPYGYTTYRGS